MSAFAVIAGLRLDTSGTGGKGPRWHAGARSSYLVLPLFALANAGVTVTAEVWEGHQALMLAITLLSALGPIRIEE